MSVHISQRPADICSKPHYIHGIIGCATCFVIDAIVIILWRLLYVWRNRRNDKFVREEGISSEDRALRAQEYGKQDKTDLQNPYVRLSCCVHSTDH